MSRTVPAMQQPTAEAIRVQDPAASMGASIEVTRRQALEFDGLDGLFPAGTWVYLNDIGTEAPETLVGAAVRLRDLGYEPVPHFAARRVPSVGALHDQLGQLRREADVRNVLVIAGDSARPAGPFASTLDLLETGLFADCGITDIGVAGHPEGSPAMAAETAEEVLRAKQDFADRTGARMRIVTQFGFDAAAMLAWAEGLGAKGISLPVHLGIAGPTRLGALLKFAARCGVGTSIGFLKKNARSITALAGTHKPDALVHEIDAHLRRSPGSLISKIHTFPFGGLKASSSWLTEHGYWRERPPEAPPGSD